MPAAEMSSGSLDRDVADFRAFNRFYTSRIELLDQHLLNSSFSLSEARVLFELSQRIDVSAKEIGVAIGLDPGYLSRILQRLEGDGLISRKATASDRRQYRLSLTAKGRLAFAKLERTAQDHVGAMLAGLSDRDRKRLLSAMRLIERLLGTKAAGPARLTLREPRPGDMGYVVQSHGALYAGEYGFDASFEALVAQIVGEFITSSQASRERCWIADMDGEPVGSAFVVRQDDETAKLRLLLVEPRARGQKLGQRLVEECVSFARACGYRRMTLWTQSILVAARRLYQDHGFMLVKSEPHRSFGQNLVGEIWERDL